MRSRLRQTENSPAGTWNVTGEGVLWRVVDLDANSASFDAAILDEAERTRAARFHFEQDRRRYVAAHVALRLGLSDVLSERPSAINITHSALGKPRLSRACGWTFNLSHSGGAALIALAPTDRIEEIGVDIECVKPVRDWSSLARDHFSDVECHALDTMPAAEAERSFLRCWTRKEAIVKATGTGLTVPTADFPCGTGPDRQSLQIVTEAGRRSATVVTLFEDGHHVSALAWYDRIG